MLKNGERWKRGENNVGKAYIFNVSTGALVHTLDNPNPFSGGTNLDRFGSSVAIKGNYAIVGAAEEYNAAGNFRAGAAYIFDVSTGNLLHTLANPTTDQSQWFGFRVDISTDYAVVGAYNYNGTNTDEGVVHVYNISTGIGTSIQELFNFMEIIYADHEYELKSTIQKESNLILDPENTKCIFDWSYSISIENGLKGVFTN